MTVRERDGISTVPRWLAAALIFISGCATPTIGGCTAIPPSVLPDGTTPLLPRIARDETGAEIAVWGQGASEVRQVARRLEAGEVEACRGMAIILVGECYPLDSAPPVRVRGHASIMFSAGDSLDQHRFDWVENGCVFEVKLPAGMPSEVAIDYAARY